MTIREFGSLLERALSDRKDLFEKLHSEQTNAYRLFHGISEGWEGLTIDRYGSLVLVQTFREPLCSEELSTIEKELRSRLSWSFVLVYNHRAKKATQSFDEWFLPESESLSEMQCQEFGNNYLIRARHPGIDPWFFLDFRAGRRFLREIAQDRSVLNLFSYTCSVGVCAAKAGAKEVWNVDFSSSNLEVGKRNAALNQISEDCFRTIQEDCFPVMRQLAGLPVGGRPSQKLKYKKFDPREFDIVVLDPPTWSKGPFGAVDIENDYPSLFKAAVLATKPAGGVVIATHHLASVGMETWVDILKRCAAKAGRPIRSLQTIAPEADFPSFDGRPPLKIVACEI